MPDAVEPIWKEMDENATHELIGGEAHDILFNARFDAIIFPFERNSVGVRADQTAVRDCDTPLGTLLRNALPGNGMRISAEISQNGFGPTKGWLGVVSKTRLRHDDHPFYFAQRGDMCGESLRIGQPNQIAKESQFACAV